MQSPSEIARDKQRERGCASQSPRAAQGRVPGLILARFLRTRAPTYINARMDRTPPPLPLYMPEVYAASVNPPRRAKRALPAETNDDQPIASVTTATTTTTTTPSSPRTLLPMRPYAPRSAASGPDPTEAPPPPAKRGRKPGPLSRTAREAQRRLNHSIIEKARRTKINDALAALKQLVPANYGKATEPIQEQLDEEDDNDDDYEEGKAAKPQPAAGKGKGKKEEKEKEFKLEILIRTVSFLQDLLQRVDVLESTAAAAPPEQAQSAPVAAAPAPPSQIMNCPSCNAPLNAPPPALTGQETQARTRRAAIGRVLIRRRRPRGGRRRRRHLLASTPAVVNRSATCTPRKNRAEVDGAWAVPDERARDRHHNAEGDGRSARRVAGLYGHRHPSAARRQRHSRGGVSPPAAHLCVARMCARPAAPRCAEPQSSFGGAPPVCVAAPGSYLKWHVEGEQR